MRAIRFLLLVAIGFGIVEGIKSYRKPAEVISVVDQGLPESCTSEGMAKINADAEVEANKGKLIDRCYMSALGIETCVCE